MPRSASPPARRRERERDHSARHPDAGPSSSSHRGRGDDTRRYGDASSSRYRDEDTRRPPRDDHDRRRSHYDDRNRRHDRDDYYQRRSPPRRRSRSPDFERDRRRERSNYHRSTGASPPPPPPPPEDAEDEPFDDEPDFTPSGLLAKESNQINGTALKYHEPPEAKKPKKKWRLYVFKDGQELDLLHVSRQSCYLFGRDRAVVDVPLDHTSCSKQHAVLQYRLVVERNEFGDEKRNIKPFVLDLESANGTTVNGKKVPASRYYELKNGDTVKFAASERDWVLLCEDS